MIRRLLQRRTFLGLFRRPAVKSFRYRDDEGKAVAEKSRPTQIRVDEQGGEEQAAMYKELLEEGDPQTVIDEYERGDGPRTVTCTKHYLTALRETNQLDRAAQLMARIQQSGTQPGTLGTPQNPLYTVKVAKDGWLSTLRGIMSLVFWSVTGLYLFMAVTGRNGGGVGGEPITEMVSGKKTFKVANRKRTGPAVGGATSASQSEKDAGEGGDVETKFADVQGCDEAKQELHDIVQFLKDPTSFNKHGARMPRGVLLVGPPGTGKTMLAKAVSGEANVPFIYASGSEFDEVFYGVGSSRVRKMFAEAKRLAPAIIFIDEIDAIGSKRSAREPQHARMTLNQLLVELDGFDENRGVVAIAATNFPDVLDPALLRPGRFDRHVVVPLPDVHGRKSILERYLRKTRLAKDVDTRVLARGTPGLSGAELHNIVNQAKIRASMRKAERVEMGDFEAAKDEVLMGTERRSAIISPEDRKLTAVHEGGHALVAMLTQHADPIHKATTIPRGQALGLVAQLPEKDVLSLTRAQLHARMDVAMGGRVAEELVFGRDAVSTGAYSDFAQATQIARAMVTSYGMSDSLGPVVIKSEAESGDSISAETRSLIDREVRDLLAKSKDRATSLIQSNMAALHKIAEELLEQETLSLDDIRRILA